MMIDIKTGQRFRMQAPVGVGYPGYTVEVVSQHHKANKRRYVSYKLPSGFVVERVDYRLFMRYYRAV